MEVLELDGKKYVKASRAASDSGYTTDYVGQLCRAGKIDSRLVGRTWYVKEGALGSHKREKTRSNKKKTVDSFTEKLAALEVENPSRLAETNTAHMPAYRKRLLDAEIQYSKDDTETMPYIKQAQLEVEESHARAPKGERTERVPVRVSDEKTEKTEFEATELETPTLEGSLKVTEAAEGEEPEKDEENVAHTRQAHKKHGEARKQGGITVRAVKANNTVEKRQQAAGELPKRRSVQDMLLDITPSAAAFVAVIMFLSGLFLESVWTYQNDGKEEIFDASLDIAAVGAMLEDLSIYR